MKDEARGQVEITLVGHFNCNQEIVSSGVQKRKLDVEKGLAVIDILNKLGIDPDEVGLIIVDNEVVDETYEAAPGISIKLFPFVSGG